MVSVTCTHPKPKACMGFRISLKHAARVCVYVCVCVCVCTQSPSRSSRRGPRRCAELPYQSSRGAHQPHSTQDNSRRRVRVWNQFAGNHHRPGCVCEHTKHIDRASRYALFTFKHTHACIRTNAQACAVAHLHACAQWVLRVRLSCFVNDRRKHGYVPLCSCVCLLSVCAVVRGSRPPIPPQLPESIQNIVTACWAQQPEQRPTFSDVCVMLGDAIRTIQDQMPTPSEPGPTIADITEQRTSSMFY